MDTADTAGFLFKYLSRKARARKWKVTPSPTELGHTNFHRPYEAQQDEHDAAENEKKLHPCRSAIIDVYAVYVGALGKTEDAAEDFLLSHHRRAAWARSWLDVGMKENIYIFLSGPPGSGNRERTRWKDLAYAIERDERICRKLVWLPSDDNSKWKQEADEFCDRTVFAEPWRLPDDVGELDPVTDILSDSEVPPAWREVLLRRISETNPPLADVLLDCLALPDKGGA